MEEVPHGMTYTLAMAAFSGVFFIIIANKIRVSAISLLLVGGILLGPEFLGLIDPAHLGKGVLGTVISLSVGLILFEGGLTLDMQGYRSASTEIWNLLTKGVAVTFLSTTLILWGLFQFSFAFCALAASLVIVTGPTVIGPLLQRIRVRKHLHHLLHWEAVLIDPIGVFVALLCYEWIISSSLAEAPVNFLFRFAVGAGIGLISGVGIQSLLKWRLIPEEHLNIFVVVAALLTFGLADVVVSESGLLSVTIAGFWVGSRPTPYLRQIVEYKTELKDLLIGLLFVLLAANLKLHQFQDIGWLLAIALALVMFVVRPLNIFISSRGSSLTTRDKLFLSWIAPRGIVAASMASLFAYKLGAKGGENVGFLEPFTYSVIAGTVLIQALTARSVGSLLGVLEPRPEGWLIIGAHRLSRAVGRFLKERGLTVILVDTNASRVRKALRDGLTAVEGNDLELPKDFHLDLYDVGNVLAVTSNAELNRLLCMRWKTMITGASLYCWVEEPNIELAHDQLLVGERVWSGIDSQVIAGRTGKVVEMEVGLEEPPESLDVLIAASGNGVFPYLPEEKEGSAACLVFKPLQEKA